MDYEHAGDDEAAACESQPPECLPGYPGGQGGKDRLERQQDSHVGGGELCLRPALYDECQRGRCHGGDHDRAPSACANGQARAPWQGG